MTEHSKGQSENGRAVLQDVEAAVMERYGQGAQSTEPALCCPVDYDPQYLSVIPQEILDRDYGCGDPSRYVRKGDVVLDLGSGGGKICYIAAQIVGETGRVIGVDMNQEMLSLARKYRATVAERLGYENVVFRHGRIQDLRTDLDILDGRLKEHPVTGAATYAEFEVYKAAQQAQKPLIPDESVDIILSNCVLNLVRTEDKTQLFREMFRVLRRGGRVAISDIVSDETVPEEARRDPELWSGCISGAFLERDFMRAFEDAGFFGVQIAAYHDEPFRVVDGIHFNSVTVTAMKGKEGPCLERNQAVIYKGPWRKVHDDDGHVFERGVRTAVCDKTFQIMTREPYQKAILPIPPLEEIPLNQAGPFACDNGQVRHPRETKGLEYHRTTDGAVCDDNGNCC